MTIMNPNNTNHSKMPSRKLSRLSLGTAWLFGWLMLAAWFGFGREWLRQTPAPAMASPNSSASRGALAPGQIELGNRPGADAARLAKRPKLEAVAISSMKVGDQVSADNPTGEHDDEFGDTVDPPSWRKLVLLAPKKDGSFADVELLRPLTWLEEQQAEVGGSVDIHVPECGIEGRAEVLAIESCPTFKHDRRFRIVTGTFKHQASKVLDVYVEGLDEPIGTTPNHPFWSEDRQTFVRADELKEGEHLRAFNGTPIVRQIIPLADPEPVFNLEVQCDHVYHVARSGVLVHNGADDCLVSLFRAVSPEELADIGRTGLLRFKPGAMEVKQFGRNIDEVIQLADEIPALREAAAIIEIRIPRSILNALDHTPVDISILKSGTVTINASMLDTVNGPLKG